MSAEPSDADRTTTRALRVLTWVAGAVACAGVLSTLGGVLYRPQADEGQYFRFASRVSVDGLGALRALFAEYVRDPQGPMFPAPWRMGHVLAGALLFRLFGPSYAALSAVSFASYVALLFVAHAMTSRFFGARTAALSTVLLAFSPILMGMAQRALGDSTATLALIGAVWAYLEALERRSATSASVFGATFGLAILVKETAVLQLVPFLAGLAFLRDRAERASAYLPLLLALAVAPLVAAALMALAMGSVTDFAREFQAVAAWPSSSPYAIAYQSGPWFRALIDFMLVSPFTLLLAVGFVAALAVEGGASRQEAFFVLFLVSNLVVFAFLWKNLRYLMMLDVPIRVLSVLLLERIARARLPGRANPALVASMVTLAAIDAAAFSRLFVVGQIYDPVSANLLQAWHLIP